MKVSEAKELVLSRMFADLARSGSTVLVSAQSPDGDEGKFVLDGKTARAIHHFDGWYVPVNLDWFVGSFDPPVIHGTAFHWYVFAIPAWTRYLADHYFLCDYLQMRDWVLDFTAPLGKDHRDHRNWRADLRLYPADPVEREGYFRWGDEPPGVDDKPARVFELDNVTTIRDLRPQGGHIGTYGPGGESAAHKLLKLYVASHPLELGFSSGAKAHVEYSFPTGDRVDVLFENHRPDRTVVEVEVEGEQNLCVGILQAIKYRSLAAVDAGYPLLTGRVGSLVVAYNTDYPKAITLAERYEVSLRSIDRESVLAKAV
ncbi:MAG: hypothetical protein M0Z46_22430 [Actinomycetota bacterium]|jgi:hypothetical protein|nr:hypothetical protein [Actinomycetota bacterium]